MKLFYWDDVQTIADYSEGHCFALAETKERAIDLVLAKFEFSQQLTLRLREELSRTEPRVIDSEEGFLIWGGS